MKKLVVLLLAVCLIVGAFSACTQSGTDSSTASPSSTASADSGSTESPASSSTDDTGGSAEGVAVNPKGEFPIVNEPITLRFFYETSLTEEEQLDMEKNHMLEMIREKTNINLEFTYLNYNPEGKQKMILSFASGDYPDGGMLSWNTMLSFADVVQYGVGEGILLPINDQIDQYGDEINWVFEQRPGHKDLITAPDGNIYGIPRFTECGHCMSYPKLWFNYGWLDALGLDEPTTTDELYDVLKAFKEQDPNGNGIADEIPLTGTINFSGAAEYYLMNSFIDCPAFSQATDPRPFLIMEDGKVTFMANRDEYRQGLEYIKKLYDDGLLDPSNFTQNDESLKQPCRGSEIPTVGGYTVDHMDMGVEFVNTEVSENYHALPPVAGPDGVRYQPYNPGANQLAGFNFVLFDTCSNPDAAFRLADWFLSEDMLFNIHYGLEGVGWNPPADPNAKNIIGGPLKCVVDRLPSTATEAEKKERNLYQLGSLAPTADLYERRAMWAPEATEEALLTDYETRLEWETLKTTEYWPEVSLPRNIFMSAEDAIEFNELKLNISQHVEKNTSMFITGARSLTEWDTYVQELDQYGLERYVELYSQYYLK
ncbi:MAG: extracellular solute-binding protein [Oscillospiraceae bacterium]